MFRRVELYRFVEGSIIDTQTRGNKPVTYNAGSGDEVYVPQVIGRGAVESRTELSKASLEITLEIANPVAQRYLTAVADSVLSLTIFQQTNNDTLTIWKGRLSKVKLDAKKVTLTFESIFTSLRRPGLRARYQKACRHSIYGPGCNVVMASFLTTDDVSAISGTSITMTDLSGNPAGYFIGGIIETQDNSQKRYIVNQSGNVLTLQRPFEHLQELFDAGPVSVNLYPGCPKNIEACIDRFNNVLNYGGFPWIPSKNPMGGSSIL